MKKRFINISHLVCATLIVGSFYCAGIANGQTPTPSADRDMDGVTNPNEKAFNTMGGVGAKPSKAELAKMKADKAKNGNAPATNAKAPMKNDKMAMAKLDQQDQAFLMNAAKGGMMEVEMGKMAVKMGKSPGVKAVGQTLVADHTRANGELMALAKAKGVKLPAAEKAPKMSKDNFDSAFLTMAMKDHQKDIAAFERASKSSKDADVKAWAKKMVPVLKGHMNAVKKAMGSSKAG